MKELLKIAKEIIDLNKDKNSIMLTGTLSLWIRGLGNKIGRKPHDIDLLIDNYASNILVPEYLKESKEEYCSDGTGVRYSTQGGKKIDIMSSGEPFQMVNGFPCSLLENLLNVKYYYARQNNPDAEKHKNDIINLGYKYPKSETVDDLPF